MSVSYTVAQMPRGRKTVVTLLKIVGTKAVPGHLLQDFDMTWANSLMAERKKNGERVTITALLLKAVGIAQQTHPLSRTEMIGRGKTVTYNSIVGGITVEREVEGEKTVFFGEISSPQFKTLTEIAEELDEYSKIAINDSEDMKLQTLFSNFPRFARSFILELGKAIPPLRLQCQKATFGLTTLGKYEVSSILSPCICTSTFAIATIEDKVVVIEGEIVVRSMMTVSFNFDQRVLDPNSAAHFLHDVKRLMEGELLQWIEEKAESSSVHC